MKFELQRADFWKRISAFMFDVIVLGVIIIMVATAMSAIFQYDKHVEVVSQIEKEYEEKYIAEYGVNPDITAEEFAALTEEEKAPYYQMDEERQANPYLRSAYNMLSSLKFAIPSVSILIGYILAELVIPIFFKNGQTLGKKAFGLGVIHTNGVRMHGQAHFVRVLIGKCLIETLVPFYFVMLVLNGSLGPLLGIVMLGLLLVLQIFAVASTKTRSTIHDLVSDTVVVDMLSQMVFETPDDLMEYKQKLHEEMVNKQEY